MTQSKIKYGRQCEIWRVVKHSVPSFDAKHSSIVVGPGEELAVESLLIYTTRESINYSLEDCDEQTFSEIDGTTNLHNDRYFDHEVVDHTEVNFSTQSCGSTCLITHHDTIKKMWETV
ncbi:hypothetical protein KIN20_020887 [Parelaphostrongylus tenuis]|uniref:Uncharacterized protein n=1 Tax=Parelaphostrongylus tenuis TaxID=148309 RepID=A0AAD5MRX0_PARTN|nr:hypothetical protein KIN20_020887 [Parelaphostrongylus tenuis]